MHLNYYKSIVSKSLRGVFFLILLFFFSSIVWSQNVSETAKRLPYPFEDHSGLVYDTAKAVSPLMFWPEDLIKEEVIYNPLTGEYLIRQTINGKVDFRPPVRMLLKEYIDYDFNRSVTDFWQQRARREKFEHQSGLIPKLYVGGKLFETIFGSNTIDIKVRGQATLTFAVLFTQTDNYALPLTMRRNTTFDFDERIQINVNGKIGENLEVEIKYDTEAAFDFENKTNIRYKGDEDDIIQRIEAGNVSLPLTSSLIRGNQSLFGILTELKFGKLNLTTVFSQQKSETRTIQVERGAQKTKFKIKADEYDENRHFFLNHSFKDNYAPALQLLPLIQSGVSVQNIEIWVLNRQGSADNTRNILAFMDLAENNSANLQNPNISAGNSLQPSNNANNLYETLGTLNGIRDISTAAGALATLENQGFQLGRDYEIIENARKLSPSEYKINQTLGYISLNTQLRSDDILAVAYKYTVGNQTYTVGELSNDLEAPNTLIVKLIKGSTFSPRFKNWSLMMKNVYRLGGTQLNREDFILDIAYYDVNTGRETFSLKATDYPEVDGIQLLRVMNLDNLNLQNERTENGDGVFDFFDGITVDAARGLIYFPVLEPFGRHLQRKFGTTPQALAAADKYVFLELYDSTKTIARQLTEKNKFFLMGEYKSGGGSEIMLNAMNIPQGSVRVTHGGRVLQENVDYTVDYMMGRLTIINPSILESGTPVKIVLESQNLFSIQNRTMMGAHLTYDFGSKFNMGATILNLRENPFVRKVNIGSEPINNTIWGLNASYKSEVPFLTKLVDHIPLINTKTASSITLEGEFAHLIPGHNKVIGNTGKAFIDDFEGASSNISINQYFEWRLASTPRLFSESNAPPNDLSYRKRVAHLSWYNIDPSFYTSRTPVSKNALSSLYTCQFRENELFPNVDNQYSLYNNIVSFDLSYYPRERGTYNYAFDRLDQSGFLIDPEQNWAGIQRALQINDFENMNIEYIEFWLMDPYAEDAEREIVRNARRPSLYINLGDVSEDVLKDGKKSFEQGLPRTAELTNVTETGWGRVPTRQAVSLAFDNNPNARQYQDIGLDGLNNDDERNFFLVNNPTYDILPQFIKDKIWIDPSADDFRYFRGAVVDNDPLAADDIIERYKYFSGTQNNSPVNTNNLFTEQSTSRPDGEDINNDFTLNQSENYFQYYVDLSKENLEIYKKHIVDEITVNKRMPNGVTKSVRWYQFKIPLRKPDERIGEISDFRSIRFMRMFLTGFDQPVILRFARLDLVRSDWRRYEYLLEENSESLNPNVNLDQMVFEISTVNIERNSAKTPVNYLLPPGVSREIDQAGTQAVQRNEQSLSLKVIDLPDGYARAVFKNINMDMRRYGKLQMFIHAESVPLYDQTYDNEVTVFVRIGTDFRENYYEYELPLQITPPGRYPDNTWGRTQVWPIYNNLELPLAALLDAKNKRNQAILEAGSTITLQSEFFVPHGKNKIKVKGNPNLAEAQAIMIGVRNPRNDGRPKSVEVWINELALTDFVDEGGWAATGRLSTQLADFANFSISGSTSRAGFGSLEQRMQERQMENIAQYDLSTSIELGKFFPAKALIRLPFYFGYGETFITPKYNPLDQDVPLDISLSNPNLSKEDKDYLKTISQDYTRRKSWNFTNIKIGKPSQKNRFWEIAHWTGGYSFTETHIETPNVEYNNQRNHTATLGYVYNYNAKVYEPFKSVKFLSSPSLSIIKEINFSLAPSQIAFNSQINRRYDELLRRNLNNPNQIFTPTYNKNFRWTRNYQISHNLTRGVKIDFRSNVIARVNEVEGRLDREMSDYDRLRDTILVSLRNLGEITDYNHTFQINSTLPISKIPGFKWISATATYSGQYDWKIAPRLGTNAPKIGNQIQNSNQRTLNLGFNTNRLFTSIKYIDRIHKKFKTPVDKRFKEKETIEVQYSQSKLKIDAREKRTISHKLETTDISAQLTDAEGNEIKIDFEIDNANRITIIPEEKVDNGTIVVTGKRERSQPIAQIVAEYFVRISTGLQNVNISYNENHGSIVNGYMPDAQYFLGTSRKYNAPGIGFLLGFTDPMFIERAIESQWLSKEIDQSIVNPYTLTFARRVNIKAVIEPLNQLQITIDWIHNSTFNETKQYFTVNGEYLQENGRYIAYNQQLQGNFTRSFLGIKTSFQKIDKTTFRSPAIYHFMEYRKTVAWELARARAAVDPNYNPGTNPNDYPFGYSENSPDVLRHAFLTAFEGSNPKKIDKKPGSIIPSILSAAPNWKIDYKGLSDISYFKRYFRGITLNHAYTANYTIGSFQSNPDFIAGPNGYSNQMNIENTYFIPQYILNTVSFQESFNPLTGLNLTWKNGINTGLSFRKDRTVSLNLTNSTISEIRSWDISLRSGYTIKDVPIVFRTQGGQQRKFVSNVNINGDFTVRDNVTYNHQFSNINTAGSITTAADISERISGKINYAFKISADYQFNKNLNLRGFYEHTVDKPYIATSFRTVRAKFGFSVNYRLTE